MLHTLKYIAYSSGLFVGWLSANSSLERAEDTEAILEDTCLGTVLFKSIGMDLSDSLRACLQPHVVQGRFVGYQIAGFDRILQ